MTDDARHLSRPRADALTDVGQLPAAPAIGLGDRALADALLAGDDSAFTLLVEFETDNVFRICHRVLGDITEAEEATQEAFVQAYKALATYRGEGEPRAWLSRIAVREAWRRGSARTKHRDATTTLDDVAAASFRDPSDVQREVLANEERDSVRDAVARLHSPYREIILDRYFANLSLKEISAATGRPLGTVKVQVHRGLAYLRKLMEEGPA